MDRQTLISAGYKQFQDNLNGSAYGMQKRVTNDLGTKYFINIYAYAHNGEIAFQPEVQFSEGEYPTTDVTLHSQDLEIVESLFEQLWCELGMPYYERRDNA